MAQFQSKLPITIERKGMPGCMLAVGLLFAGVCIAISIFTFYSVQQFIYTSDKVARSITYLAPGIFIVIGLIVFVASVRSAYNETIEIDQFSVRYLRSGRLRLKTERNQALPDFIGITMDTEDGADEATILAVSLKHHQKKKNIILATNISSEEEQEDLQHYYACLLKMNCVDDDRIFKPNPEVFQKVIKQNISRDSYAEKVLKIFNEQGEEMAIEYYCRENGWEYDNAKVYVKSLMLKKN